jgi:hypothetical protein
LQPKVTIQDGAVVLEFQDLDSIRGFIDSALRQNGFVVSAPRELKMFQRLPFRAQQGEHFRFGFEVEVIQIFPEGPGAFGTALQIVGWTAQKEKDLERRLQEAARGRDAPTAGGEVPAVFGIREMNVTEKMRLAMKASRLERQILAQDNSPQVLTALLANPRIETEEIVQIVKSPHASGGVLQQIASNQRWGAVSEIQRALVLNPKTPTPLVLRLLDSLSTPDLGALAKSGKVRENIRKAALRLYLKRTQR